MKKLALLLIGASLVTAASADVYIEHDVSATSGAADAWRSYLNANYTSASLGTIYDGEHNGTTLPMGAGDLVIFTRSTDSGLYDDQTEPTVWNESQANILMMNAWSTRLKRFGYTTDNTINTVSVTGDETTVLNATDSLFAGVNITGGGLANLYTDAASTINAQSALYGDVAGTGDGIEVLATVGGNVLLARIDQGAAWYSAPTDGSNPTPNPQSGVHGGDRILFYGDSQTAGSTLVSLTPDGDKLLENSLVELGLVAIPEPATLGLVVAMGGGILFIRRRFMI